MNNPEKLVVAFAIFVIAAGVFVGIGQYAATIDISTLPEFVQPFVTAVQKFFSYSVVAFIVAYLRNILGYLRNYVKLHSTEKVEFDMQRYYDTILYYIGPFNIALAALPEPYNVFAAGLTFVIDVFTAEYKKIVK